MTLTGTRSRRRHLLKPGTQVLLFDDKGSRSVSPISKTEILFCFSDSDLLSWLHLCEFPPFCNLRFATMAPPLYESYREQQMLGKKEERLTGARSLCCGHDTIKVAT